VTMFEMKGHIVPFEMDNQQPIQLVQRLNGNG